MINIDNKKPNLLVQIPQKNRDIFAVGEDSIVTNNYVFGTISLVTISFLTFLFTIIFLKSFYKRASKRKSFVRTGFGGEKIIKDTGAWVFPYLHEITPVNMNTLRLLIKRQDQEALITKDLLRINIQVDCYVRVKSDEKSIKDAAQTLGDKTQDTEKLISILEGKIVSALSITVSEVELKGLHEDREFFVETLKDRLKGEIANNGLELETVSLTYFNQANPDYFDPENILDVKGLSKLTEEIENKRQERNRYEKEAEIAIHNENQDAELKIQTKILEIERQKLELQKEEEIDRLDQESELSKKRMLVNQEQEKRQQELEEANLEYQKNIELKKIESDQEIFDAKNKKELYKRQVELENEILLELKSQDQAIEIARKSCEQSKAQAELFIAQANTVIEEEKVVTAKEEAKIEREKKIALIRVEEEAKTKVTLSQGEAEAIKLIAEAEKVRDELEATGKRFLHEANNLLSKEQIDLKIKMAIIEHLPEIIRESVKPMEKIEEIKIYQVEGLNGFGNLTSWKGNDGNESLKEEGSVVDQMISGALKYRVQAPMVDSLMKEIGLTGNTLENLTKPIQVKSEKE